MSGTGAARAAWAPEGRLRAGDRSLEYACLGPPPAQSPTLVLLHEGLGSVGLWRGFPAALAEATGRGVFAYSRAGYGGSDPVELPRPLDYMTREAVDVLPAVLDAVGVLDAALVGHSDGATIAAIHAGRVADPRVRALVLMAPHFFTEPAGLAAIAEARVAFETGDLRARLARHHANPDVAFRGWNDAWLDPGFERWDVADVVDGIAVPTLAIQGRDDQYGTLAQVHALTGRARAPLETLVLDGCRHAPHLEREAEVVAAIVRHLARAERFGADAVDSAL